MQISKKFNLSKKVVLTALFFILITGAFLFLSNLASAATDQFGMNYPAKLGLSNKDPRLVILELVRIALGFVGIIAVIIIMYAGFLWMTSAGNEQKVDEAKKTLVNAIIGLVIILSAFLIVSFIINKINGTLIYGPNGPNGGQDRTAGGLGAIGNCAIETVYPESNQRDVPRNTSIVVTFKEIVNPGTIISAGGLINTDSVKIYKSNDSSQSPIAEVTASTTDNRTFIFTPVNYLGSPSENIWYAVTLTDSIRKPDGKSVFEKCGFGQEFTWSFEVSNKIDLTPPQVLAGELFPSPDNEVDDISGGTVGVPARGAITVIAQPRTYSVARINSVNSEGTTPGGATAAADIHCTRSAVYTVTMLDDSYAALSIGLNDNIGSAVFVNRSITFAGYFTLTAGADVANGQQWTVDLTAEILADNINVGGNIFTFTTGATQGNEIHSDADNNTTALNIETALTDNSLIRTERAGNRLDIIALQSGTNGNNIALTSSNPAAFTIIPMTGGVNNQQTVKINGKKDQPRNSIIQINFNEAINPLTVSGDALAVSNYLQVVNASGGDSGGTACALNADCLSYNCVAGQCQGDFVNGKFIVSNIYRTVEFISDNLCGVNSCGERIYCLPENSNLRVEVVASPLAGCDNCPAKTPYTNCTGGHCYDDTNNRNHPLAVNPPLGIVDMALNSLDGNRDGEAVGPDSFFDENTPLDTSLGDSYQWSFFISDIVDLTTPEIDSIEPRHTAIGINLFDPVKINFNKIMMSGSLKTGSTEIDNGRAKITHKSINLWNYSNNPVGFWVAKTNIDNTNDGNADYTQAEIRHSIFADMTSYRAQAGSGVKDIYQNCFSPSAGNYGLGVCPASTDNRSCCPSGPNLNPATVNPGANCNH